MLYGPKALFEPQTGLPQGLPQYGAPPQFLSPVDLFAVPVRSKASPNPGKNPEISVLRNVLDGFWGVALPILGRVVRQESPPIMVYHHFAFHLD